MSVSREEVLRIAALARIAVPTDRVDGLAGELTGILGHMEVLANVQADAPSAEAKGMPLARDEGPAVPLDAPRESFAPEMRDGFFLVPRLHTHDDAAEGSA